MTFLIKLLPNFQYFEKMFFTKSKPYLTNVSERFLINVTMIKFLINVRIKTIVRLKYPIF